MVCPLVRSIIHSLELVDYLSVQAHNFMPPPRSREEHIVLPLSVRTSVTLFITVLVSATSPTVFDAGI